MKKILVVEDNENNMYLITFILQKAGYEIAKAETGEKGVKLAASEKPDLILMDVKLPGIDGLEATKRIRKSKAGGKVPIIALTSYAMTGDREKFLAGGCSAYIEKPINPDTILSQIKKFL